MEKEYMTWKQFDKSIRKIARWSSNKGFKNIYGIPRGGQVVAVALSHQLDIPLANEPGVCTLVVDDICDTGHTLEPYKNHATSVLYYNKTSKIKPSFWSNDYSKFVVFPWETEQSAKRDYRVKV